MGIIPKAVAFGIFHYKGGVFLQTEILYGKDYAQKFKEDTKKEIAILKKQGITPGLAVIIVGEDQASKVYVKNKHRTCEEMGIYSEVIPLDENTTKKELIDLITRLNNRDDINGILVQLPLPKPLAKDEKEILETISPKKDVDGFHPYNAGKLYTGDPKLIPCTPLGCLKLLEASNTPLEGKNAVVLGRSNIVGKPMAQLLLNKNATVTICHSKTKNLKDICKNADIIVVAIGKEKFLTKDMVKEGAVVLDVGINRGEDSKLYGDCDFENILGTCGKITPVPGGIGLLTIAMLMHNTVEATKLQRRDEDEI